MEIKTGMYPNTLILTDVALQGKNFSGSTGLWWDKFNDGTSRKIALKLSPEEAEFFASRGGKVRVIPANPPQYPDATMFIEVRLGYKGKKPPEPGQAWDTFKNGPRVVMIVPGGKNTDLTEDTVGNLDRCYIRDIKMRVRMAPARLKDGSVVMRNGVPGITLYADAIEVTVQIDELDARLYDIPAHAAIADQEDYEDALAAGVPVPF